MAMRTLGNYRRSAAVILAILLASTLQACAKRNLYPGDRRPDDQVAYVEAERFLMAGTTFEIDGVDVGSLAQYYVPPGLPDSWFPGKPTIGASVLPGAHKLSVHVARYGWVSAARTACAVMTFQAAAGQRYKLFIDKGTLVMRSLPAGTAVAQTNFSDCLPQQNNKAALQ